MTLSDSLQLNSNTAPPRGSHRTGDLSSTLNPPRVTTLSTAMFRRRPLEALTDTRASPTETGRQWPPSHTRTTKATLADTLETGRTYTMGTAYTL